ncbi:MAG: glycoside hydrolase family 130 protein [Capsulimonadales bacterium]|nr:glycoside hydrolase family 130 protein [Capsulimonadales bacterium]
MNTVGPLRDSGILRRYPGNPVLSPRDVPYPSQLAYNAGVVRRDGRYVMVFRNDSGWAPDAQKPPDFQLGLAFSEDGIRWDVRPETLHPSDDPDVRGDIDPRLVLIDDRIHITYCQWTAHGYRATIAITDDFVNFEIADRTVPDNRDMVLFPERIDSRFLRLERPFPIDSRNNQRRFDIWISESPDLNYWGKAQLLLAVEDVPFANERLGAGPPPIRTGEGWLVLFHAVDVDPDRGKNGWEDSWQSRYTVGAMLLDLDDPRRVLAVTREPLMIPQAPYEVNGGFRNNVVFPTALVPEPSGEIKLYYGAADTVTCLATASLEEIVRFCKSFPR